MDGGEKGMALDAFLKQNKKKSENVKIAASPDFVNEKGDVIEWEIRPLRTKEAEKIRSACSSYGKGGKVTVNQALFNQMVAALCTVYPNLNDRELQDSYGVMGAEDLICELLDKDGVFQTYVKKCLEISGYAESDAELVEEAKN